MNDTPLLSVDNLTIAVPGATPVRALGFEVSTGETLALVGESGSGKSLSALALMGLLPGAARIQSGQALFEGTDLLALPPRAMRTVRGAKIGMIFQEPMTSLNPVMTIGRQIGEVLRHHRGYSRKAARARAIELLDLVRIPDARRRVDDYPHNLSGGMRQRVMIAIAVACEPRLLIADEPTTALDVTIQAQILDLLDRLRRELSMAVILISHDLGVVAQWADRVSVMYAGRRVEEGSPEDVFATPLHPYTRGLIGASPRITETHRDHRGMLPEIPGSIASASGQTGCAFAPRCALASDACREAMPPFILTAGKRGVACPVHLTGEHRVAAVGR